MPFNTRNGGTGIADFLTMLLASLLNSIQPANNTRNEPTNRTKTDTQCNIEPVVLGNKNDAQ